MHGKVSVAVLVVVGALVVGACGGGGEESVPVVAAPDAVQADDEEETDEAVRGSWLLVSGTHDGEALPIPTVERITLIIDAETLQGVAGCNNYGVRVEISGSRIAFGEGSKNDADCAGDVMIAEAAYMRALRDIDEIEASGDRLVLRGPVTELRFERQSLVPTGRIVDRRWRLAAGENDAPAKSDAEAWFELHSDGTLEAWSGCRRWSGEWVLSGDEIRETTLRAEGDIEACSPEVQAFDGRMGGVIGDGFRVVAGAFRLTLISRDGERLEYRLAEESVGGAGGASDDASADEKLLDEAATVASGPFVPVGGLTSRRFHTATRLDDGTVLLAGGFGTVQLVVEAELFDPVLGITRTGAALLTLRQTHTATLLEDGRVLITGGAVGGGDHYGIVRDLRPGH